MDPSGLRELVIGSGTGRNMGDPGDAYIARGLEQIVGGALLTQGIPIVIGPDDVAGGVVMANGAKDVAKGVIIKFLRYISTPTDRPCETDEDEKKWIVQIYYPTNFAANQVRKSGKIPGTYFTTRRWQAESRGENFVTTDFLYALDFVSNSTAPNGGVVVSQISMDDFKKYFSGGRQKIPLNRNMQYFIFNEGINTIINPGFRLR